MIGFKLSRDLTFFKVLFPNLVVKRKQVLFQFRHRDIAQSTSNVLDNDRKIFIISGRSNLVSATDNAHWQALKLEIASQLGLEHTIYYFQVGYANQTEVGTSESATPSH